MTSNATSIRVVRAKAAGLVEHVPLEPPRNAVRAILCLPDVDELLSGKAKSEFPALNLQTTIGRFIAGHGLTVSRRRRDVSKRKRGKRHDPGVELERLDGFDEIWVLCVRRPGSGWRVIGRMLERNVLVLLRVRDKLEIGNDYAPIVAEVLEEWRARFGDMRPQTGNWISDYLSGSHYDADEKNPIDGGPP